MKDHKLREQLWGINMLGNSFKSPADYSYMGGLKERIGTIEKRLDTLEACDRSWEISALEEHARKANAKLEKLEEFMNTCMDLWNVDMVNKSIFMQKNPPKPEPKPEPNKEVK